MAASLTEGIHLIQTRGNGNGKKNHSVIFPKMPRQFDDNKETESVERRDGLIPEEIGHFKKMENVVTK